MNDQYINDEYMKKTGGTWHIEDSPWKAEQISAMIKKHGLKKDIIGEIGCGAGAILSSLSKSPYFAATQFRGYDISPQAIALAEQLKDERCEYLCSDLMSKTNENEFFDVLLVIDVIEHVPDYMGFAALCKNKATYKIYHIPLDLHLSSVFRNAFVPGRYSVGHLHYFTAESAIATLKDTGHEIIDFVFTPGAFGLFRLHPTFKKGVANLPRWIVSRVSESLAARWFGGYSLLVLTK